MFELGEGLSDDLLDEFIENLEYFGDYFCMEDILVTQEKVSCKNNRLFPSIGGLKPGNKSEFIPAHTNLELPIWVAIEMSIYYLVTVEMPKVFQERTREILKADCTVVNLFRINPHYYEFSSYITWFNFKEDELVKDLIMKTFKLRLRVILDWAEGLMTDESKIQQLESSERNLFKSGFKSSMKLALWLIRGPTKMKAIDVKLKLGKENCCH